LLQLSDFEVIKRDWCQLIPKNLIGVGPLINRLFSWWAGIRHLCLRNYIVAQPVIHEPADNLSVSTIVLCRNGRGNIENAIFRMPLFYLVIEIILIEGHSSDGAKEETERVIDKYPEWKEAFLPTRLGRLAHP
jgi:hypothetical protein